MWLSLNDSDSILYPESLQEKALMHSIKAFFMQKRKARIVCDNYDFLSFVICFSLFFTKINLCLLFEFSRCSISNTPVDLIIGVSFSNP